MTRQPRISATVRCELMSDAKFVAAEKHVAAEERVAFPFEKQILRQPDDFVTVLFHPAREMRRFAGALLVSKIAGDKLSADGQSGIGGENHVRKLRLGRDELDLRNRGFESVSKSPFHCAWTSGLSAPRSRLIQGLISYSMP